MMSHLYNEEEQFLDSDSTCIALYHSIYKETMNWIGTLHFDPRIKPEKEKCK